jgi:hypothetical protein
MQVELKEGQIDQKLVPPQMVSGKAAFKFNYFLGKAALSYF